MNDTPAKKLQTLIRKWKPVLAAKHWSNEAEDSSFGDACFSLGFEMDAARSLQRKYPGKDVFRASFLRRIIRSVNDVQFLGSAIFSYWRYLTHWHEAPLPDDAPEWFAIAFDRLSVLADSGEEEEAETSGAGERENPSCDSRSDGSEKREPSAHGKAQKRQVFMETNDVPPSSPFKTMRNYRFIKRITVAGVRYLEDRGQVLAATVPGEPLRLVREVDNLYDNHAIRIDSWEDQKLGYVPRKANSDLAEQMDRGVVFVGIITALRRHESRVEADIYERLHIPFPDFAGFTLRTFGFFAPETRCSIFPGSRRFVHKTRNPYDGTIQCIDFTFSPAYWGKVMELIQRCNFLAWEDEYLNPGVCDGMQWNMTIRRKHAKSLKITGDNAYPEEWNILTDLIEDCLDLRKVKGNGKFYLESPRKSRKDKGRRIPL